MRRSPPGSGETDQSSLNQCSQPSIRVVVDPDGAREGLFRAPHAVVVTAVSASNPAERRDLIFRVMELAFRRSGVERRPGSYDVAVRGPTEQRRGEHLVIGEPPLP